MYFDCNFSKENMLANVFSMCVTWHLISFVGAGIVYVLYFILFLFFIRTLNQY